MKELLECPWSQFVQKIGEISDTTVLQTILWNLEGECEKMQKKKEVTGNFKLVDIFDSNDLQDTNKSELNGKKEEAKMAFSKIKNIFMLERKISFCREILLMNKNKKILTISEGISEDELTNFSFGIQQLKEPKKLFDTRCKYTKDDRIVTEKMSVSHCADLKWFNLPELNIDQIEQKFKMAILKIKPEKEKEGKISYKIKDLKNAIEQEEKNRGQLELIRIQVNSYNGLEPSLDYFMLISNFKETDWRDPMTQEFFIQTYLSNTYRSLVAKASKKGECLYGGRIVKNLDGKMEVKFRRDEIIGAGKANKVLGTIRELDGKEKRKTLKNMIISIRDNLANKSIGDAFGDGEGERE